MTWEEEQLLRRYLARHGEIEGVVDADGFGAWYRLRYCDRDGNVNPCNKDGQLLFTDPEGDGEYKHTLYLARVWERRYHEGYQAALDDSRRAAVGYEVGAEGAEGALAGRREMTVHLSGPGHKIIADDEGSPHVFVHCDVYVSLADAIDGRKYIQAVSQDRELQVIGGPVCQTCAVIELTAFVLERTDVVG